MDRCQSDSSVDPKVVALLMGHDVDVKAWPVSSSPESPGTSAAPQSLAPPIG
jgi:hypothetical protein